ncbi:MAG: hypothetical protein E6R03_15520 [Hyphomicrobiaceae bacterium]|nr:MAG: hypothetical protein E6R03_15520 [Hyphomicrobiaceae bacterium]
MTLGEFHQLVGDSLRRGTTLSTQIANATRLAVTWLERNYTFKHMEVFRLFQLVEGARTLDLPTNSVVKAHKFLRLVNTDGTYTQLNRVEPEDIGGLRSSTNAAGDTVPARYWVVGNSTIVFDAVSSATLNGEAMFYVYSDWPRADSETHSLLTTASDVLLWQTLMNMAVFLKDAEMAQANKLLRDEALNTLVRAEDENKYGGESLTMAFIPQSLR